MKAPPLSPSKDEGFARARDAFLMRLAKADVGEAAARVAIVLAVGFSNRKTFSDTGTLSAWPSMRTLAAQTGLFRGRISRALGALESAGLITVERPEKRGVGHHLRYTLHPGIGLIDEANSKAGIGLTDVTNSEDGVGPSDEANSEGGIGLKAEDVLSSPVRTDLIEDLLEKGAGAQSAPLAPEPSEDLQESVNGQTGARERAHLTADLEGRELYLVPDLTPPDASEDLDHTPFDIEGDPTTLTDLDRLADEEAAAAAHPLAIAAAGLAAIHGEKLLNPRSLASDIADGFLTDDADAAAHASEMIAYQMAEAGAYAEATWTAHREIARRLFAALAETPAQASDALNDLGETVRRAFMAEMADRRADEPFTATTVNTAEGFQQ